MKRVALCAIGVASMIGATSQSPLSLFHFPQKAPPCIGAQGGLDSLLGNLLFLKQILHHIGSLGAGTLEGMGVDGGRSGGGRVTQRTGYGSDGALLLNHQLVGVIFNTLLSFVGAPHLNAMVDKPLQNEGGFHCQYVPDGRTYRPAGCRSFSFPPPLSVSESRPAWTRKPWSRRCLFRPPLPLPASRDSVRTSGTRFSGAGCHHGPPVLWWRPGRSAPHGAPRWGASAAVCETSCRSAISGLLPKSELDCHDRQCSTLHHLIAVLSGWLVHPDYTNNTELIKEMVSPIRRIFGAVLYDF